MRLKDYKGFAAIEFARATQGHPHHMDVDERPVRHSWRPARAEL